MGESVVVVDVSAGLLLGGFPQQAALVVEELYELSGRNPAVVQVCVPGWVSWWSWWLWKSCTS